MESFYGGRQGASFVIKDKFKYISVDDPAYIADVAAGANPTDSDIMATCLADPNYTQTWYNEYCIIDTTNKNNPYNGKIYRRTIDATRDELLNNYQCAEYIGQIVGPSSGAAFLKPQSGLLDFDTMRDQLVTANGKGWDGLGLETDGKLVTYDPSFAEENINSTWPESVKLKEESMEIDKGLTPGVKSIEKGAAEWDSEAKEYKIKTTAAGIRDDIKYNWFNVRKNTENNEGVVESWCYIGFDIPTTTFSVEAVYKTPGTKPEVFETANSEGHPFWYDWRFEIPGGLRGISIESIFINDTDPANEDNNDLFEVFAYKFEDLEYDSTTDTYKLSGSALSYTSRSWFCKARVLNPNPIGSAANPLKQGDSDLITFFLGKVVEIDNVELNPNTGHLVFKYHNQEADKYDLRYPIQIDFTREEDSEYQGLSENVETPIEYNTGEYTITYSYADETKEEQKEETGQFGFVRKVTLDEGADEENGTMKFTNSIDEQTQTYAFSYPKTVDFIKDANGDYTGSWEIDYFGAEDKSGQFGFIKGAEVDDINGKIYFYNTIEEKSTEDNLIYVKDIDANTDTGVFTATYSNSSTKDFAQFDYPKSLEIDQSTGKYTIDYSKRADITGQFGFVDKATVSDTAGTITFHNTVTGNDVQSLVYAKAVQMDDNGKLTYTNSASQTLDMGQIVFIDHVVVNDAHQLLIAYTDNSKIETNPDNFVTLNGKTYINYGQTVGTLGVTSGPMPTANSDRDNIDAIVAWYNKKYGNGMIDGEVSGQLHVVTTDPIDSNESPVSYFVMWDPDANPGTWKMISEIAGAPVGIPAQIGKNDDGDNTGWTYEDYEDVLADGAIRFVQMYEEVPSVDGGGYPLIIDLEQPWK